MATQFISEGRSLQNHLYQVYFDVNGPSTTLNSIPLAGLSVRYKPNEDDVDANLLLSTCSVTILVQNAADRARVTQIISGNEAINTIRVLKNGSLFWAGVVQVELSEEEDLPYPQYHTITATDGIGRLKKIPYLNGGVGEDEYLTIMEHIQNVLDFSPVSTYYTGSEEFLRVNSTLWPDELTPDDATNVLESIRVSSKVFRTVDRSGEVTYFDVYQVLREICEAFGLRFFYAQGRYVLQEIISPIRQDDELRWNRYDKDFNVLAQEVNTDWEDYSFDIGTSITPIDSAKMLRGGKITQFPPARRVVYTYKHYTKQNLFPGYIWNSGASPTAQVSNFRHGGGIALRLTGSIRVNVTPPPGQSFPNVPVHVVMRIACWVEEDGGSAQGISRTYNYAGGLINYNPIEWAAGGPTSNVAVVCRAFDFGDLATQFDIVTPEVPVSGTLNLTFALVEVIQGGSTWVGADATYSVENVFVESLVAGSVEDQYQYSQYILSNDDFASNSEVLERETIIGDGPQANTFGRLEAKTGPNPVDWELTTAWRHHVGGAFVESQSETITRVIAEDLLSLRSGIRKELDTEFISRNYSPEYALIRNNLGVYAFREGVFDLLRDEVRGNWIELVRLKPTQTDVEIIDIPIFPGDTTPVVPNDTSGLAPPPPPTILGPPQLAINTAITTTDQDLEQGQTYTLIDIIGDPASLPLIEGTTLIITHPITGQTQTVVLDADFLEGVPNPWIAPDGSTWVTPGGDDWIVDASPGLSVEGFTALYDFPEGSYIQITDESQIQIDDAMSEAYRDLEVYRFNDPVQLGINNAFWRPVERIGWKLRGVSIAFGENPNAQTARVIIRHKDNSGTITTIATYEGSGLTFFGPLEINVAEGYYYPEVEQTDATIKGMQLAFKLRKTLV